MNIAADSLLTPQAYSLVRPELRRRMIAHRRQRSLALGPAMRLAFEDELTVRHQIQEVLRAESGGTPDDRRRELATYAHLVPDGTQWIATLMIEVTDARQRRATLGDLSRAAHRLFIQCGPHPRLFARTNHDLSDGHWARPSGVHFLHWALPSAIRGLLLQGQSATIGCDCPYYDWRRAMPEALLRQLRGDLAARAPSAPRVFAGAHVVGP